MITNNLICLKARNGLSQRNLAQKLQLAGYDIDKNVITLIETQKRYVTDIEIKAICEIFQISFEELISETN
jgi:transcriptional regulator with XRE-family HTH domain